jgi:hypothetical protein
MVDLRGGDDPKNISNIVGSGITSLEFSLADSNVIYVLSEAHDIRRVSLSNSTVSAPLLTDIAYFSQGDRSTITYGTLPDPVSKERSLGYWTTSSATPRVLRTAIDKGSRPADISMSTYYGDQYVVFANGTNVEILTGDLPVSDSTSRLSLTQVARYNLPTEEASIGFSPAERRFVYAQFSGGLWTYDLEIKKLSKVRFDGTAPSRPLDWLNTYHFATTNDGMFAYYDYDGTNRQVVGTNVADLPVAMSENSRYFYHFATTEKGISLIRTKLTVD